MVMVKAKVMVMAKFMVMVMAKVTTKVRVTAAVSAKVMVMAKATIKGKAHSQRTKYVMCRVGGRKTRVTMSITITTTWQLMMTTRTMKSWTRPARRTSRGWT